MRIWVLLAFDMDTGPVNLCRTTLVIFCTLCIISDVISHFAVMILRCVIVSQVIDFGVQLKIIGGLGQLYVRTNFKKNSQIVCSIHWKLGRMSYFLRDFSLNNC